MLLDFKVSNFKSFVEQADFSMTAAPKQKGLDYSLTEFKQGRRKVKAVCSSIIYGPNAAGKSNIISAMDVMRSIVLRGNVHNPDEQNTPDHAVTSLELIPNNTLKRAEPVTFDIDFYTQGIRFTYAISIDLGEFLNETYDRKIINETFDVNGKHVFTRTDHDIEFDDTAVIKKYKLNDIPSKNIVIQSLDDTELFLTNGFKLLYAPVLVKMITDWFRNDFIVIYRDDIVQVRRRFGASRKNGFYVEKTLDEAAKVFGVSSNALGYVVGENDGDAVLCSFFKDINKAIPADIFESYGTLRFINMFPVIIQAMQTGATLAIDELDASLHPMALISIINIFHNDDINVNHAQLIFNSQSPVFLNSNYFRRDEIKFVERDDKTHRSILYALSDFGTSGASGVRKKEDYMNNYFESRYGAIRDIDFTPIFEKILKLQGDK